MDYAILATLWNGPATMPEVAVAVYERLGRPVSPRLVESNLRMLARVGFIEARDGAYRLLERGSVYLAHTAVPA
jgi:DNA-binding PadR family transcriptional regulator